MTMRLSTLLLALLAAIPAGATAEAASATPVCALADAL
jgi:hypothetical protein